MASAAELQILLKTKDQASSKMSQIGKNADKLGKRFQKVGLLMVGAGVAVAAGLFKMTQNFAKAGDEIAKMAKRTGFGTEALSELRFVAQITGAELRDIEKATKRMALSIVNAERGLESYARAFDDLGIDIQTLKAQKPEEQFFTIAGALGNLEDQTLKTALAQEIFGRAGTNLIPLFQETEQSIKDLREEAERLGIVFSEEDAAAAEELLDAQTRLKASMTGLQNAIAVTLLPALTELTDVFTDKVKPAVDFLRENPEIIQSFLKFGAIFLAGGAMFLAIGSALRLFTALKNVIIAVRTAAIFLQAVLAGPAGIAKILAGLGIATGVVFGLAQLEKQFSPARTTTISPGQLLPPLLPPRPGEKPTNIIIQNNIEGSVIKESELAETVRTQLIDVQNRNVTTGIE